MTTRLHIYSESRDEVRDQVISADERNSQLIVLQIKLTVETDYSKLLDAVFEADTNIVW